MLSSENMGGNAKPNANFGGCAEAVLGEGRGKCGR